MWCVENKTSSTLTQTQTCLKSAQKVITCHKATKHLNRFVKKRPQRFVRWLFSSSMYSYIYIYLYIYIQYTHTLCKNVYIYIYIYICIAYLYIDKYQLYMCWLVHTIPLRPSFGRSNANDQKTRCVFFSAQELTVSEKLRSKFLGRNLVNSLCVESFHDFRVLSSNKFWSSIVQKTTILTYSTKEYIYIRIERERDSIWFQDSWYWPNHKTVIFLVVMFAFHTWKKKHQNYPKLGKRMLSGLLRCCFRDVDTLQQYLCIPTSWRKICRKLQCVATSHGFL